ncbi:UNVERIFIED_CONTAM: hypothetical protein FKN15_007333 [Acipenser sinensis]
MLVVQQWGGGVPVVQQWGEAVPVVQQWGVRGAGGSAVGGGMLVVQQWGGGMLVVQQWGGGMPVVQQLGGGVPVVQQWGGGVPVVQQWGGAVLPLQPHVRVWDSVSLSTLQIIGMGTFERGVGSLAFSKADSGIHLCVIDDSNEHMMTVWDWQKKSKIAEIKTTNEVVLVVEFHPTDANTIKYEKPKFIQCLAFLNNGDILTGDSGGIMLIWSKCTVESTAGKGPKGNQH